TPAMPIAASSNKSWLIICVPVNWPSLTSYLPVLSAATSSISVPQVLSWPYFRWPIILPPQGHFSVHQKTTLVLPWVHGNNISLHHEELSQPVERYLLAVVGELP